MSEEEIKIFIDEYYKLKNIQNSIKEIDKDFFFNLVDKLLYLYNKEKETSHYIQSQLDIANAKLIEEKEKNRQLLNSKIGVDLSFDDYIGKDKIREILKKYGKTEVTDYVNIIKFYKEIEKLLEE